MPTGVVLRSSRFDGERLEQANFAFQYAKKSGLKTRDADKARLRCSCTNGGFRSVLMLNGDHTPDETRRRNARSGGVCRYRSNWPGP